MHAVSAHAHILCRGCDSPWGSTRLPSLRVRLHASSPYVTDNGVLLLKSMNISILYHKQYTTNNDITPKKWGKRIAIDHIYLCADDTTQCFMGIRHIRLCNHTVCIHPLGLGHIHDCIYYPPYLGFVAQLFDIHVLPCVEDFPQLRVGVNCLIHLFIFNSTKGNLAQVSYK